MATALFSPLSLATTSDLVFEAGHPSLQKWLLPEKAPEPTENSWTKERSKLGKMLFFDPRLSRNGTISCATCHNPMLGWSDGLKKGVGINGSRLGRASPVVTNTAHNFIQMWDGRKKDLEDQATGPMDTAAEMHTNFEATLHFLASSKGYTNAFKQAYPGQGINRDTIAKAIASFERTIISNDSPFDRWVHGDPQALNSQQVAGFKLFVDPKKGNCEVCHSAPNFVDDGFHNIGLKGDDLGRYTQRKVKILKRAFKTPTLRDIELSAPYFHDG
ncbi:MAG: cytochrome c peroxidase, partial [Gammaproteobacteria bacterium]|nr:cytochrome c peroxidase [Gammaproteobacteria bacterium]